GNSVSSAGDVNGDGIDDLMIGAPDADPNGSDSGQSYVILGTPRGTGNDDLVTGTSGNDTIEGLTGNDSLLGLDGNDSLLGQEGNDSLIGALGDDTLNGGQGNDTLTDASGLNQLLGGAGNDYLNGGSDNDYLNGGDGNDVIYGDNYSSTGIGGQDTLLGGNGDDYLDGDNPYGDPFGPPVGDDVLKGGAGNDTYFVNSLGDVVIEYPASGLDTVRTNISYTLTNTVENLEILSTANIDGTGNALDNEILGAEGNNRLNGGVGNDQLVGDSYDAANVSGNDTLIGGDGIDTLFGDYFGVGFGADVLSGGNGADFLFGEGGNDNLTGGTGADALDGGDGKDVAKYNTSSAGVLVNLGTGTGSGGDAEGDVLNNIENLVGSAFDDTLVGNSVNNSLAGGAGADSLDGGAGKDTAKYSGSSAGVLVNLSTGTGSGGDAEGDVLSNIENLVGSACDDTLMGNSVKNSLVGGAGNDSLNGGGDADTLTGAGSGDLGVSIIDTLTGGAGSDVFVLGDATSAYYNDGIASGSEFSGYGDYALITDFNVSEDVIRLVGTANDYYIGSSPIAGTAGTAIYLKTSGENELIAVLDGGVFGLNLTDSYFQFI
ncbi:hypothetical protein DO97_09000, partial [Neosynechococcus sphagnicola sy1]